MASLALSVPGNIPRPGPCGNRSRPISATLTYRESRLEFATFRCSHAHPRPPYTASCRGRSRTGRTTRRPRLLYTGGRTWLVSVHARTGEPDPDFGVNGRVDLTRGLDRTIDTSQYSISSAPLVTGDTVLGRSPR